MMNAKAKELGCEGTNFTNPHGLHDDNHYTTAYDIYLICNEAMKYPPLPGSWSPPWTTQSPPPI